MSKLNDSLGLIRQQCSAHERPAIMSSFGKDSTVVIALCRMLRLDPQIIYHRFPWFPEKNKWADEMTAKWNLVVWDWLPSESGIQWNKDTVEPVSRYQHGSVGINISPVILPPDDEKPYLCGRYDILERPKGSFINYKWDLLLLGQKTSDVDNFSGPNVLKTNFVKGKEGAADLFYPIKEWNDSDVWDFIEKYDIPYQEDRYENRGVLADKTNNNDYVHACMNCVDPRLPKIVHCPKLNQEIPNVSELVRNFEFRAPYIEYTNDLSQ